MEDEQINILRIVVSFSASLSLIGTTFIIVSYSLFPKVRTFNQFLIFLMSISDFGAAVVNSILIWFSKGSMCTIQAFLLQYFDISGMLWTMCIAFHIYQGIRGKKKSDELHSYLKYYLLICYILPLVSALITFAVDGYGFTGAWCWIPDGKVLLRFSIYYAPMVFIWTFNLITYISTIKNIKKSFSFMISKAYYRLTLYVVIFIITRFPGLVNRLHNIIEPHHSIFWLYLFQALFSPMGGFLNSLVYGMRKQLRVAYRMCLPCCSSPENESEQTPLAGPGYSDKRQRLRSYTFPPVSDDLSDSRQEKLEISPSSHENSFQHSFV